MKYIFFITISFISIFADNNISQKLMNSDELTNLKSKYEMLEKFLRDDKKILELIDIINKKTSTDNKAIANNINNMANYIAFASFFVGLFSIILVVSQYFQFKANLESNKETFDLKNKSLQHEMSLLIENKINKIKENIKENITKDIDMETFKFLDKYYGNINKKLTALIDYEIKKLKKSNLLALKQTKEFTYQVNKLLKEEIDDILLKELQMEQKLQEIVNKVGEYNEIHFEVTQLMSNDLEELIRGAIKLSERKDIKEFTQTYLEWRVMENMGNKEIDEIQKILDKYYN